MTESEMKTLLGLAVLLSAAAVACGSPSDEEVKAAFLKENPSYEVTLVAPGEGDSGTVYMHICYRRPGSETECEVV